MYSIGAPELDAPVPSLSLLRPVQPNNMIFLFRGQTRLELVNALSNVITPKVQDSARVWMLVSTAEVVLTLFVCAIMLYKKRALGKLWIITKRDSLHGTFFVGNAVYVLVLGVTAYLVAWGITAVILIVFAFVHTSVMEWWWVIPLPWLPLVLGAYTSIHGFAVGCSPRSPLSTLNSRNSAALNKWYYIPIPKSAAIVNTSLILPCVLFVVSTVALVGMSGHKFYCARDFTRNMLSPELLLQIQDFSTGKPSSLADGDVLASDELVWLARTVAANYMQMHRYVCLNLAVFAAAAFTLFIPCIVYGMPNLISLVDHTYACYSPPPPVLCDTSFRKLWFLLTQGRPNSKQATTSVNLGTWKMTILAILYMSILFVCVPAFGWIPVFIVADTFPHRVLQGDISPAINRAIVSVSVVTNLSCTFVAIFCTVATLDPLFRAAIGLNILRSQIPINIDVETRRSRYLDHEGHELFAPVSQYRGKATLASPPLALGATTNARGVTFQRSFSTLDGRSHKSPMASEFPDYPANSDDLSYSADTQGTNPADPIHKGTDVVVTMVTNHD